MIKQVRSPNYNYNFDTESGYFERWGEKIEDNPIMAPYPEIIDIEIATSCNGIGNGPCKHCYKSNTPNGRYTSFDRFKEMFDKLPNFVTQVALGIGDLDSNPDLFKITEYLRNRNIIPNVTTNGYGLTEDLAEKFSGTFGAISVSRYNPKDVCYEAVKKLTDLGMKQVNIHMLVSEETYEDCLELIHDRYTDSRLSKMNAIVFLALKSKGKRNHFHSLNFDKYKNLVDTAMRAGISIGFDSCSAPLFLEATKESKNFNHFHQMSDSCESFLFSLYINVDGKVYPCSFIEGEEGYAGIDMFQIDNFQKDVWQSNLAIKWRENLLSTNKKCSHLGSDCRMCPQFNIYEGVL